MLYSMLTGSVGVKLPRTTDVVHSHTFGRLCLMLMHDGKAHGVLPSVLHQLAGSRQLCTQMPRLNKPRRVRLVRQWKTVLGDMHQRPGRPRCIL